MACDFILNSDEHGEFCVIPLSEKGKKNVRFFTQINVADFEDTSKDKWSVWVSKDRKTKYAVRRSPKQNGKQKTIWMHRQILNVKNGVLVDHKDGDGLNNRRFNLRIATNAENQRNQYIRKTGTSPFKGVCSHKKSGLWQAKLVYRKHQIWLGTFKNEIDAARAYDEAAKKYFGVFARLNFPEEKMSVFKISEEDEKNAIKLIRQCKGKLVRETSEILSNRSLGELELMCKYLGCNISQLAGKITGGVLG